MSTSNQPEKCRYYVVVLLTSDSLWDYFIYDGRMDTADDIETVRKKVGKDAVIINWKRIE